MHYALSDTQVRLEPGGATSYSHIVRVVDSAAGLGRAGQIQAVFDPTYQSFVMHRLVIVRDGRRIEQLDHHHIQLLHRETQLESRLYDGTLTVSIVLDDVRVGDHIDYAYSVRGANPVFGGRYVSSDFAGSTYAPMSLYRLRILVPAARTVHYRAAPDVQVTVSDSAATHEIEFRRSNAPQLSFDNSAPESYYLPQLIQLSEFDDWAAVARWGQGLFGAATESAASLRATADEIRAHARTTDERVRAALDFVQTRVRYFGNEMGASSHRPASPAKVLEQRFGDCKDKVSLLVALLRELGVEATPVLVSSHLRGGVTEMLPSPLAFDHVIARVSFDGHRYFLDGTRAFQSGGLDVREALGFGSGLALEADNSALASLPGIDGHRRLDVDELIRVTDFTRDPVLEARLTYFGDWGEALRSAIASQPREQIESRIATDYGRFYPHLLAQGPIEVHDVPESDAVTIIAHYTIPGFWHFADDQRLLGDAGLWAIDSAQRPPSEPARTRPYRVPSPGEFHERIRIEFPEDVYVVSDSSEFTDAGPTYHLTAAYTSNANSSQVDQTLELADANVSPAQWSTYMADLTRLRQHLIAQFSVAPVNSKRLATLQHDMQSRFALISSKTFSPNIVTLAQGQAAIKELQWSAVLDGQRIGDELRAQALRERGVVRDMLGWWAMAGDDFAAALKLAPDDARTIGAQAVNAFLQSQYDAAIDEAHRALEQVPADTNARTALAYASYFQKDYGVARDEMQEVAHQRGGTARARAALWVYLAARRAHEDGAALAKPLAENGGDAWPYPLLRYLVGSADFESASRAATKDSKDPTHLCELYFYAAEKSLLDGDTRQARSYYQKSIDTGVVEVSEYVMAKRSLAALPTPAQ